VHTDSAGSIIQENRGGYRARVEIYFMVKHTARDKVWCEAMRMALEYARYEDPISVGRVNGTLRMGDGAPSDRTIRDVLNTMAEQGWLRKEKPQSHSWLPGEIFRHVNVKKSEPELWTAVHHQDRETVYRGEL
jgi:hypothetical protein